MLQRMFSERILLNDDIVVLYRHMTMKIDGAIIVMLCDKTRRDRLLTNTFSMMRWTVNSDEWWIPLRMTIWHFWPRPKRPSGNRTKYAIMNHVVNEVSNMAYIIDIMMLISVAGKLAKLSSIWSDSSERSQRFCHTDKIRCDQKRCIHCSVHIAVAAFTDFSRSLLAVAWRCNG